MKISQSYPENQVYLSHRELFPCLKSLTSLRVFITLELYRDQAWLTAKFQSVTTIDRILGNLNMAEAGCYLISRNFNPLTTGINNENQENDL